MYAMKKEDYLLLEAYKAIGTPADIIRRLDNPFPDPDEGYAPLPQVVNGHHDPFNPMTEYRRRILGEVVNAFAPKPDSGLLEDDE